MTNQWLGSSWHEVWLVLLSTAAIFVVIILYVRLIGLRSFSKMSSFDFAMTVAVGSIMATVAASPSTTLLNGVVALAGLFGVQFLISLGRKHTGIDRLVDNQPVLLMAGDRFLHDNLDSTRVTVNDVKAKLREANVLDYASVQAVVLETTGDISVLHGDGPLDPDLLESVRGAELLIA